MMDGSEAERESAMMGGCRWFAGDLCEERQITAEVFE